MLKEADIQIIKNDELAELVGIILGDGSFFINNKVAQLDIAFNLSEENYCKYVEVLLQKITNLKIYRKYEKNSKCVHLRINKKYMVKALVEVSLMKFGNKIKNQVTIPEWVWKNEEFLKSCLRGLIDTDGSLYKLKPHWPNLYQLSFRSYCKNLLEDARKAFVLLGFHPSKIFDNRIVITRQNEIIKYFKEIGTNNLKYSPEIAPSRG